jgi:hypothetical protein
MGGAWARRKGGREWSGNPCVHLNDIDPEASVEAFVRPGIAEETAFSRPAEFRKTAGLGLAKRAVNGDLGQGALENRELLVVQIRDE